MKGLEGRSTAGASIRPSPPPTSLTRSWAGEMFLAGRKGPNMILGPQAGSMLGMLEDRRLGLPASPPCSSPLCPHPSSLLPVPSRPLSSISLLLHLSLSWRH